MSGKFMSSKEMKRRSAPAVMGGLIGLVKPLLHIMILAVLLGTAGYLCAIFLTILAGQALLHGIVQGAGTAAELSLHPISSVKYLFLILAVLAVLRGVLHYMEQYCNHFIAFKLLAIIRHKVFAALRKLCPAKLEGRDRGNLISIITTDIELLEVFYAHTISPVAIAVLTSLIMTFYIGRYHIGAGIFALAAYLIVGALIPFWNGRRGGASGMEFRTGFGELNSFVLDSLRGLDETIQYRQGQKRSEEMEKRFMAAAKALGLDFQSREAVTETYPDYLNDMKETEWVTKITGTTEDTTLTVYANGETEVKFEPAIKLPGNYNFTYGNTSDGEAREVLDYLCGEYSDLIGFDEARKITWNSYGISSDLDDDDEITNSYPVVDRQYQVTDISGEGAERLLNTNFRQATFAPYDDNSLWIIRVYDVYDSLEKLGDYPLISIDEAKEKLQKGESAMIGTDEKYPVEDMSKVVGIELSYKYSVLDEYTLPYYVFWVETGEVQFGLKEYSPIYVPAIEEEYISDIPTYDGYFNG